MNAPYPKENDETEFIKLHNEAASSYVLSTKRINHACQYIPFTYYVKLYTYIAEYMDMIVVAFFLISS